MLGIGGPCNNEDWVRGGKSIGSKEYELLSDSIVTKNAGTSAQITPEEVDAKIGKGGFHAENMRATGFCAVANTREMTNQESQLKEINAEMRKARFNESPFPSSQLGPKIDRPPTLSPFYEKGIGAGADFAGGMISGSWIMLGFLGSIRVLSSVPSDCYTCIRPSVPVPSEQFPASIEPYPKRDEVGAIVRGLTIGPKQGLLVREYPGEEEQAATTECVPPGFLSTDSQGRYYVVNMASNESFGGRIFRYNPTNMKGTRGTLNPFSVEQELVGAVTYFNLNIQLARPAYPVAMTVGPKYQAKDETGKMITTQDLFVANIDVIDGKRQILKVPISLIDTKASVYGPANRHRIVGLPVIESDEFYFTGPSDMEVGPDPNSSVLAITENSVIMLSDESNIFAFYKDKKTENYHLRKVISIPSRRWSGLAFDRMGRFYFADYNTGDIFVMLWSTLKELVLGDRDTIRSNEALIPTAFLIGNGPRYSGDIELEGLSSHPGGVLYVSTLLDGVIPINLPIIGPLGNATEVKISLFGKELPVKVDGSRRVFIATPSREDLTAMSAIFCLNAH
jgi:hypothetical protein